MINLSSFPIWVIPSIIIFIFGFGVGVNQFFTKSVSKKELIECQEKRVSHEQLDATIESLEEIKNDRDEIWEIIRKMEQNIAVFTNDMVWLKTALNEIKDAVK